jgi:proteasome lid subunit RPN8/RPN11
MISSEQIKLAKDHALKAFPEESCGVVIDGKYIACRNVAEDPLKDFEINPEDWVEFGEVEAVIHSHTFSSAPGVRVNERNPRSPTHKDMACQIEMGVPWAIIPTDGEMTIEPVWFGRDELSTPLVGRVFIHGITDCYGLIRAYFWQELNIFLPDFPRDENWWKQEKDLYSENFAAWGFKRISQKEAKAGDVFLAQINSPVPNHGGVYLDNGLAIHHLAGRLSRREPIGPWTKFITHWLRYDP